jgi:uncharacterized membrane protein YbhN (UPF0104 family)
MVSLGGGLLVAIALAIALAGHGHDFIVALGSAPFWVLGIAVVLHVLWLLARTEAWGVCIEAAGGTLGRRSLYRASSIGYLANIFNGQFGCDPDRRPTSLVPDRVSACAGAACR